jgi:ligand-binding SRPBCC domain-containing protein
MIYKLYKTQQLHCDISTAWQFFSSPHNLARITPKDMNFVVKSNLSDENIYEGMTIAYTVSPLLGIPVKWLTKITQVEDLKSFTDFQQQGPYKSWNHFHEFIPNEDGVLIKDTVDYELPFGIIGTIFHFLLVRKKLEHIFDYRYQVLNQLFNKQNV